MGLLTRTFSGMSDFGIAQGVFTLASSLVSAGGAVGSAFLQADAAKTQANAEKKAAIVQAIANERALVEQAKLEAQTAQFQSTQATQQLKQGTNVGALALVALGVVYLATRESKK